MPIVAINTLVDIIATLYEAYFVAFRTFHWIMNQLHCILLDGQLVSNKCKFPIGVTQQEIIIKGAFNAPSFS